MCQLESWARLRHCKPLNEEWRLGFLECNVAGLFSGRLVRQETERSTFFDASAPKHSHCIQLVERTFDFDLGRDGSKDFILFPKITPIKLIDKWDNAGCSYYNLLLIV